MQQSAAAAADKAVGVLLKGQVHIEANARFAARATVGGFHDAAASSGHHLETRLNGAAGKLFGQLVAGIAGHGAG